MAEHHLRKRLASAIPCTAFLLLVILFAPSRLLADHIVGNSISYQCINACTVRVEFRAYRSCASSITNISPINTLFITADPGCVAPTPIFGWVNVTNVEVTPVCPGTPTLCNTPGAAFNGVMEHFWVREYDFCAANCSTYTIAWGTCCRNTGITTLINPQNTGLYTSTTFNPFLTPCNSSPSFTSPPVAYICQNQSYVFSQGATDPDGDSLSYSIGPCRRNATQGVNYFAFTSPTSPLGGDWNVSLNASNGDLQIVPNPLSASPGSIQVGVICIYVTEWRNGVAINTIERDMQVNVIPCSPNDHPVATIPFNVTGGTANNYTLQTCLGATLCAEINVLDLDAGQVKTIWWDQSLAPLGATFVSTINSAIQDTISGLNPRVRFCWTPLQAGTYTFVVNVRDDACPIFGASQQTYTIEVGQIQTQVDTGVSGCHAVAFCALPLTGTAPFSYFWNGSGGLNTNPGNQDSCLFHNYPVQGNFPFTLQVTDAWGCEAFLTDTISIFNNVTVNAGNDTSTCSNQAIIIGGQPSVNPDLVYLWSPNQFLNNNQLAQPTVTQQNLGPGALTIPFVVLSLDTLTLCTDLDTTLLTIFPIPESPFIAPDSACVNQAVGTIYTGLNNASATYDWTYATGAPATHSGQGPHLTYFTTPGYHEITLTVTQNGCSSPVERDTIRILPRPVAQITPVPGQCLTSNNFQFSNQGYTAPGVQYLWTFWPNASPSSSTLPNPGNVVFSTPGPKRATLQLTEHGCPGNIDTLTFNVFPNPNPNWMVIGGVQCFDGNSYQFQTTGGNGPLAQYAWTFQDGNPSTSSTQNPIVQFSAAGQKVVTMTVTENGCSSSRTDTILVFPEPVSEAGPNVAFCAGDGGVALGGQVLGGSAPFYYNWTCGAPICGLDSLHDNDPIANPSVSTWYFLQIVDQNGCESGLDSVFVTVHPKPIVNAGPDIFICGDSAPCQVLNPVISGSPGPFSYQWVPFTGLNNTSILNPCVRPDTTTIYTLVATDLSSGCSSDYTTTDTLSSVTVHVNPVPVANAGHERHICPGDTAILAGSGTGAGPLYSYQWSPSTGLSYVSSSATAFASPASTFAYTLVVWSNGCASYADTTVVHVHTTPSVDAGWDREICLGESTLLDASAGGDSTASYTFMWNQAIGLSNPQEEDPIASPYSTTTYHVVAISSWGCESAADSVQVRLRPTPVADAGPNTQVCAGDSTLLQGSYHFSTTNPAPADEIHFAWTPSGTLNDPALAQPSALPTASGWYHVAVTHGLCTTFDSCYVVFIPDLQAQATADTTTICAGDEVRLQAAGGIAAPQFTWYPVTGLDDPHAAQPLANPSSSMTYHMVVTESGCSDTASLHLEVLPRPSAAFAHSQLSGCAPLPVSFLNTSSGANFVWWEFGDGSPVSNEDAPLHTFNHPGTYQVRLGAVDTGQCDSRSQPVTVTVFAPPVLKLASTPIAPAVLHLPEATVSLEELGGMILDVHWDFGDGIRMEGQQVQHTYRSEGNFMVDVHGVNPEGCVATMKVGPFIVLAPDLDIPNVFSPNGDGISDDFLVSYSGDQPFRLEIRDRWGARMYQGNNKTAGWDGNDASGARAPEGTYYYLVVVGGKEYAGALTLLR